MTTPHARRVALRVPLRVPKGERMWSRWVPSLALATLMLRPLAASAAPAPTGNRIVLTALRGSAGEPSLASALSRWASEARLRTSLETAHTTAEVSGADDALFRAPLLVWAPARSPVRWSDAALGRLREHLAHGGTLVIDDTSVTGPDDAVDRAVRALALRLFGRPLADIPHSDVIFRAFYRLGAPVGRRANTKKLEGLRIGKRWAIIYGRDDLLGALRPGPAGEALPAVPGGEAQREQAIRLAVNLVIYATCLDYKDDHVHVETLLRTRRGGASGARGRRDDP